MTARTNLCPSPFGGALTWNGWAPIGALTLVRVEDVPPGEAPVGTSYMRGTLTGSAASIGVRTPIAPARALMAAVASGWVRSSVAARVRWRIDAWRGAVAVPTYTIYVDADVPAGQWAPLAVEGTLFEQPDIDGMRVSTFYTAALPVGTTLDVAGVLNAEGPGVPPFIVGTRDVAVPRFDVAQHGAPVLATPYAFDGTPAERIEVAP